MTELPIEKDLREALAVDPSPSFVAGVRARAAAEPERVGRRFGFWMWMPAAVGALAIAALVVAMRTPRAPIAVSAPERLAARSTVSTANLPSMASSLVREDVSEGHRSARHQPSGRREPEILISASESHAIRRFIEGPRTWKIDPSPLPVSVPPPVTDLVIEPIAIEPLSVDRGQGVRQ